MALFTSEDRIKFLEENPQLRFLAGRDFTSFLDFQKALESRGVEADLKSYQFFNQRNFVSTDNTHSDDVIETSLDIDKHDLDHHDHEGHAPHENIDSEYKNVVENAVRDWNRIHPDQKITGKVFIKKNGDLILNPEVKKVLPYINKHAADAIISVHGEEAYLKYKSSLENASYKNPGNDPQFQEMENKIEKRIESETKDKNLSSQQLQEVETRIRMQAVKEFEDAYPEKAKHYGKKIRFRNRVSWYRDSYRKHVAELKNQYKNPELVQQKIEQKTNERIQKEVEHLKKIDQEAGKQIQPDAHYKQQINQSAIQKRAMQEELARAQEFGGRRALRRAKKSDGIKGQEKILNENINLFEKLRLDNEISAIKKEKELSKLKDPSKDDRIRAIREDSRRDAQEIWNQKYQEEYTKLDRETKKTSSQHWSQQREGSIQNHARTRASANFDPKAHELYLKQKRYEEFFRQNPDQAKHYARKDSEIANAYQVWQDKTEHERRQKKEAENLAKKRRFYKKIYHGFRPPRREYLQPDGSITQPEDLKRSRRERSKASISKRFDPTRNRYDSFTDRAGAANQKYNPYEIFKRKLAASRTRLQNQLSNLLQKSKNTLFYPTRLARATASSGVRLAGSGISRGMSSIRPRRILPGGRVAGTLAKQGAGMLARGAGAALAANPITWIVIVIIILLLAIFIPEEDAYTGPPPEIRIEQEKEEILNLPAECIANPEICEQANSSANETSTEDVLQASTGTQSIIELLRDVLPTYDRLGSGAQQGAEMALWSKLRKYQQIYTITTRFAGYYDDMIITYPIPNDVFFVRGDGIYDMETGTIDGLNRITKVTWRASKNTGFASTPTGSSSASIQDQSSSSVSFDKYTSSPYFLPTPNGASDLKFDQQTISRLNELGGYVSKHQGFLTESYSADLVDPFLSVIWNGAIEGVGGNPYFWNCRDSSYNINAGCAGGYYSGGWQVGYGIQVSQASSRLASVFDEVYGAGSSSNASKVKQAGQKVIDDSQGKISNPSSFPSATVASLVSRANSGDSSAQQAIAILLMDKEIGAVMLSLEVAADIASRNNWRAAMEGWGSYYRNNMQKFSNRASELSKSYSGTITPGSGGGGEYIFNVTLLPLYSNKILDSGRARVDVIGARNNPDGNSNFTSSTVTGDPSNIVAQAQLINDSLQPGVWGYYNKMMADIKNGSYTATKRSGSTDAYANGEQLRLEGLYWCTFTIIDAYNLVGKKGLTPEQHLAVMSMIPFFASTNGYTYLNYNDNYNNQADKKVLSKVKPGYAFFIMNHTYSGGHTGQEHTGIVKSINIDNNGNGYIDTLESNSNAKTHRFIIDGWNITNTTYPMRGFGGY